MIKKGTKLQKKGFTLLEVLIALVITAISVMGIYNLLNISINTLNYAKNKLDILNIAYEYFLIDNNEPNAYYLSRLSENLEVKDEITANIYNILDEHTLTISNSEEEIAIIYFRKKWKKVSH